MFTRAVVAGKKGVLAPHGGVVADETYLSGGHCCPAKTVAARDGLHVGAGHLFNDVAPMAGQSASFLVLARGGARSGILHSPPCGPSGDRYG